MATTEQPPVAARDERHTLLQDAWQSPPGFLGWFTHVNHRSIGRRFIITAFIFLLLGGLQAILMRTQLAVPGNELIGPDLYRQLLTMHGTTMMFFFAVPMMEGMGIYFVPLMIGTRDMSFPRLNAFGYYVYLIAGIMLYGAFFLGMAPDAGWFNYPPLANLEWAPGLRIDFWVTMITFIEVSALVAAVELVVTVFKQRAPGMSLNRMPLFVWAMLVMAFMIIFAMPALIVASVLLLLDRTVATHFFNPTAGGDPLLWQHLFWFFGHPEVYIIFVPALGFVSTIIIAFARRRVFGYTALVLALIATGFVGFGLWVHHMFATGLPQLGMSFFTAASIMIAIPTGVQFFCWIATLWGGRPRFHTPLLFIMGFFVIFLAGGLTGVMVASVPFNIQAHDTHFVVAHLHYVLIGGAVFPLFGAFHFWFPKVTGRMLSEKLGKLSFWLMFAGFNVTFFPLHHVGLLGMTRRSYTYLPEMGWGGWNMVATVGSYVLGVGILVFIINAAISWNREQRAAHNPWNADTLEWLTASPPYNYNFRDIPIVKGRYALWDGTSEEHVVTGLRDDRREVLVTDFLDARPSHRAVLPGPSYIPFLLALAVSVPFIGIMWSTWAVPIGLLLAFAIIVRWHWPIDEERTPPWKLKEGERAG